MSHLRLTSVCLWISVGMLALTGCSSNSFRNPTNATFGGMVKGGEQPVTGSTVQLYAVNTTTNGGASTPLVSATVTTSDGTGNSSNSNANAGNKYNSLPAGYFTITGDYTCPASGTQVYLTATGGNPGLAAGTNNATFQELLALGSCGQLTSSSNVVLNEVTTVGSVAALYPYMTAYNAIGSTASNTSYLAEEFGVAAEYINSSTGLAPGPNLPSSYYASSNEVRTLADVLYTCVNSAGATPGDGSPCGSLLNAAKPSGGTAPTNTVGILIDVLNNPTNNVAGIYSYISSTPPFIPYDTTAPSNWTLPILPLPQTPIASPVAGTYAAAQSVTFSTQTSGATIYYTTNGTTPTTSSTVYTGPVTVSASETVKAIAANRAGSSSAGSFAYTVTGTAGAPVISLAPGTYTSVQTFTITSSSADAAIYITTNGSTPTSSSTLVAGSQQLDQTETLKAVAIAGSLTSAVSSAAYTYTPVSQTISTLAGGALIGDNIQATHAEFSLPGGVAVDSSGNIYVADTYNQRVRKIAAATGIVTTVAGTGVFGFNIDNIPATSVELKNPTGVAVDSSGNIYIADTANGLIRKVNASTGILTTVAGTIYAGQTCYFCYFGDGGQATSAGLYNPVGVALDSSGNIYIVDSGDSAIHKVTVSTGIITTVAGSGTSPSSCSGSTDALGDGCAATSARLSSPKGAAVDAGGNLYIADSSNNVIREVSASTGIIMIVAGGGASPASCTGSIDSYGDGCTATSATLNYPSGVAVDSIGNVYIADTGENHLRKVSASTGIITTLAGTSSGGYSGDGGPSTAASLNNPAAVAVDANYNVYIADENNSGIREITASTAIINTVGGNGIKGYTVAQDDAAATAAGFNTPNSVAVDSSGNLYVADTQNNRVHKVTVATGIVTSIAGTGAAGYTGDTGLATSAQLYAPSGLAFDSSGNLYFADSYNSVIRKITIATGIITTVAGTGSAGYSAAQDGGSATSAELSYPSGIAIDSSGNIYIADTNNSRIRKVTASTGKISTIAGTGSGSYSGDGGPATSAAINNASGVAVDSSGVVYIADINNSRIRKITSGYIYTVAGTGTAGYLGATGAATSAELDYPAGVSVDSSGNIYIVDTGNQIVRKVTVSTGNISTLAGTADQSGFTGDGGAATSAELNGPNAVAIDSAGNLYIADTGNNRIRVVYH